MPPGRKAERIILQRCIVCTTEGAAYIIFFLNPEKTTRERERESERDFSQARIVRQMAPGCCSASAPDAMLRNADGRTLPGSGAFRVEIPRLKRPTVALFLKRCLAITCGNSVGCLKRSEISSERLEESRISAEVFSYCLVVAFPISLPP